AVGAVDLRPARRQPGLPGCLHLLGAVEDPSREHLLPGDLDVAFHPALALWPPGGAQVDGEAVVGGEGDRLGVQWRLLPLADVVADHRLAATSCATSAPPTPGPTHTSTATSATTTSSPCSMPGAWTGGWSRTRPSPSSTRCSSGHSCTSPAGSLRSSPMWAWRPATPTPPISSSPPCCCGRSPSWSPCSCAPGSPP